MADVMQRISLSQPPVNLGIYKTLYMMDYKPYTEYQKQPSSPPVNPTQKLKVEAQLKAKEFAKPVEHEPMKYAEDRSCQEIQPPYSNSMSGRLATPPTSQWVHENQLEDLNTVIPNVEDPNPNPDVAPAVVLEKEAEKLIQQSNAFAMPGNVDAPCIKHELDQNWNNYQQFLLETQRAMNTQVQEIKRVSLASSAFPGDYITSTDPSTYQRDYKPWPRVRGAFCRAHRNFSNLIFEDGYSNKNPWMSEYMDNYSVFLRNLNWKSRNSVTSLCSAVPHLSHGGPSQTPVAVNMAP